MKQLNNHNTWNLSSERGINKSIRPMVKKGSITNTLPLQWEIADPPTYTCSLSGYWGYKHFMAMDVIGYCFLLKEGGDKMPEMSAPLYENIRSIETHEAALHEEQSQLQADTQTPTVDSSAIDESYLPCIESENYYVKIDDTDFRKYTSASMASDEIRNLVYDMSRIEFKLAFPVRLYATSGKFKEMIYPMSYSSKLFTFHYMDAKVRKDGIIQNRSYYIVFDTFLGHLIVNNLLTHNIDWLPNSFYHLPSNAQYLYRRFLIHHDYRNISINLSTIKAELNLSDNNSTNLKRTVEHAWDALQDMEYIQSYSSEGGLTGLKYKVIRKDKKLV